MRIKTGVLPFPLGHAGERASATVTCVQGRSFGTASHNLAIRGREHCARQKFLTSGHGRANALLDGHLPCRLAHALLLECGIEPTVSLS